MNKHVGSLRVGIICHDEPSWKEAQQHWDPFKQRTKREDGSTGLGAVLGGVQRFHQLGSLRARRRTNIENLCGQKQRELLTSRYLATEQDIPDLVMRLHVEKKRWDHADGLLSVYVALLKEIKIKSKNFCRSSSFQPDRWRQR